MKVDALNLRAWMVFTPLIVVNFLPTLLISSEITNSHFAIYGQVGSVIHWLLFAIWLLLIDRSLIGIIWKLGWTEKFNSTNWKLAIFLMISPLIFCAFAYCIIALEMELNEITQYLMVPNLVAFSLFFWAVKDISVKVLHLETNSKPNVRDYMWTALVIFFYPFGIWGFQKRLNAIRKKYPK